MNLREYAEQQTQNAAENKATAGISGQSKGNPSFYREVYRAVFDFHKRYSSTPQTGEQWAAFAQDLGKTASSLDNDLFAVDLLTAVAKEVERCSLQ